MRNVNYIPCTKLSELTYVESVFLKSCAKVLSESDRLRVYSYHVLDQIVSDKIASDANKNIKYKNNLIALESHLKNITIELDSWLYRTIYDHAVIQNKISREPTPDECKVYWSWYSTFSYRGINFKSGVSGMSCINNGSFINAYKALNLPFAKPAF